MDWSSSILLLISLYGAYRCYRFYEKSGSMKYSGFAITLAVVSITQVVLVIESILSADLTIYANLIVEWGHIMALAILLGALAGFIRESKPDFAQFPKAYIGLPILIVISYFLVKDTVAIKDWLISIYQGGAILVAMLMYAVYTYRDQEYAVILGGMSTFLLAFLLFWFVPAISESFDWIWKLLVGTGIIITVLGYNRLSIFTNKSASLS